MPLYEYRCRSCAGRFEVLQRVGEGAESVLCPECGGREVSKQLSTFAAGASGSSGSTSFAPAGGCGGGGCGSGSGFT
jgi:putative FmdB family regulatory protein